MCAGVSINKYVFTSDEASVISVYPYTILSFLTPSLELLQLTVERTVTSWESCPVVSRGFQL